MPRPQTKNELIEAADLNYDKLLKLIESMTEMELSAEFDFSSDIKKKEAHWGRDKNLRDILIHLHEWHNLMLEWVANNKDGLHKPLFICRLERGGCICHLITKKSIKNIICHQSNREL